MTIYMVVILILIQLLNPKIIYENLPEWDGRFDKNFDEDTMLNEGVYDSSNDDAADEIDLDLLGITVRNGK